MLDPSCIIAAIPLEIPKDLPRRTPTYHDTHYNQCFTESQIQPQRSSGTKGLHMRDCVAKVAHYL